MTRGRVHTRVLLVEGQEELRALPWLLEAAGVPWPKGNEPVDIREQAGVDNILAEGAIEAELKASGLEALGVLVDADGDLALRWSQVQSRLVQAVPGFPASLDPSGVVHVRPAAPRVGVWVMPDNVRDGMLETMLLELRAGDRAIEEHVGAAVERAKELGAPYRNVHRAKAELHTWLAWQDPPGLQMHLAVRARLLRPTEAVTSGFVAWFRRLFQV